MTNPISRYIKDKLVESKLSTNSILELVAVMNQKHYKALS